MKTIASIIALCLFATIANAQSVEEKIKTLQATMAEHGQQLSAINAGQSRMQSDLMDVRQELANIQATLKAMQSATGTVVTKNSTAGWNSEATFTAQATAPVQRATHQPQMMDWGAMSYGTSAGGTCANGSCGTGFNGPIRRIFGRR